MVDREFPPSNDKICLKARGGVSIMVDREKARRSSKFIKAAISSEMGNVSELETHEKSEINLEHDDPDKIVALMNHDDCGRFGHPKPYAAAPNVSKSTMS